VCLLKALAYARSTSITPQSLAEAASEIEIDVLREPVGKQDQYVAAYGGICSYTFHEDDSVEVQPLELSQDTLRRLRDQLLLFYTGETRSASTVLSEQDTRSSKGDSAMIDNLHRTKQMGLVSRDLLLQGDLEGYATLMHEHWENKRRRSDGITNPRVDELYALARESGVLGGKLVGAGGGGFLLVFAAQPEVTRAAMNEAGATELPFAFEFSGATASEFT
jgi:D-glycero-alpha-D-manno-heptose-7-phosphate kinase